MKEKLKALIWVTTTTRKDEGHPRPLHICDIWWRKLL